MSGGSTLNRLVGAIGGFVFLVSASAAIVYGPLLLVGTVFGGYLVIRALTRQEVPARHATTWDTRFRVLGVRLVLAIVMLFITAIGALGLTESTVAEALLGVSAVALALVIPVLVLVGAVHHVMTRWRRPRTTSHGDADSSDAHPIPTELMR